ncbi:MAG: ABC transporter ATP-binding protein [Acetobacteraceae bacterium]|nr:ABC transporter ATP-binding protein [Acetobacteraceae bacterium]
MALDPPTSDISPAAAPLNQKLVVRALRKSYHDVVALAPTDLDVREGEFVTLLGPSGSGKTTLLMMVAGLLEPDGGDLWIDGMKATYAPPWERGIGMVFQSYALFPHLSVFENIAFPLRMRRVGAAEIRREVSRVLEIVQLPHVADRLPRALSGGQQQRIALARCIVFRPSIILMDEPLGALDKKLRDQLQLEIKQLHKQLGTTILYVTHDQQEALTMSDRICLMNQGRIEQLGTPEEVYFRPRTVFAADFLGESNILDATAVGEVGGFLELRCNNSPGAPIRAPRPGHALGRDVRIMIRPEQMLVGPPDGGAGNTLPGILRETIFIGGTTRHHIGIEGGQLLVSVQLTNPGAAPLRAGDKVNVTWPVLSTIVLPAAPERRS